MTDNDRAILRARDFWTALALAGVSIFFLWRTADIPLFATSAGGVAGIQWFESAAVVPLAIFSALLVLALVLLAIAIRDGGAAQALHAAGIGWNAAEALRFATIGLMLLAYIGALVPRVDFVIASALLITALIFGYRGGHPGRSLLATALVVLPAVYAFATHRPQAEWLAHDDDWVALAALAALTLAALARGRGDPVTRWIPAIAILVPLVLVCAMAFGFRQNVPARGGLIFKPIEYHYYVTLRPLWSR